jgi:hypothetical protein
METRFQKNDEFIKTVLSNIYELNYDNFKIFKDLNN